MQTTPSKSLAKVGDLEKNRLATINAFRAARGLPELDLNTKLPMPYRDVVGVDTDVRLAPLGAAEKRLVDDGGKPYTAHDEMKGLNPDRADPGYALALEDVKRAGVGEKKGGVDERSSSTPCSRRSQGYPCSRPETYRP